MDERTRLLPYDAPAASWDGPNDPHNPKNWPASRKWTCAMLVSAYSIIAPTASSMVVPAMPALTRDLHIESPLVTQLSLSIYVLGWGMGPLIMGPLSELYGRAPLLHLGQFGFLVFNTLCGFATDARVFLALRFIGGVFGSGPMSLGAGVLSDLWISDERGTSLAIYTVMPLLGTTAGPLLGGLLIESHSWQSIFFICSIFTLISLLLGLFFLPETFGPILLYRRGLLIHGTSPKPLQRNQLSRIRSDLARPFIMLGTQPIIQLLALYMGFLFGLNHLTISTFHSLWREVYHQDDFRASLNYIAITVGLLGGAEVTGPVNDIIYRHRKRKNHGKDSPEYRIYLMLPSAILLPTGLLLYGWSATYHLHWTLPNLGITTYSFGLLMGYQCIQAYVLDCYPVYAASAMGALTVLRSLMGFIMPVFAPVVYESVGYGWASTGLAGVAGIVGWLRRWCWGLGEGLRGRSGFGAGEVVVSW
ncbi:MFS general substrate transporter [Aspergillus sclerotioniger CBS 115572]|uniref:MFS general substrate transporter n=1 Tax=Aspergillus sclerotioniger CBS 115572 TaxID=1450535 RepID=A0A317WJQ7_9EURO|nr:MFS general substrate transporter [Aspergillus sclerotioniger CBS 115572]PWY86559.1 MFS general substrate transporter [Aspergillus sclerotioniger CBS 115572]